MPDTGEFMQERVWDRFLTEQDKRLDEFRAPEEVGFGDRPALLLVDLYRAVYGDKPQPLFESLKKWPASCGMAGWNALPATSKLLNLAREVGMPVIHVTHANSEEDGVENWKYRGTERKKSSTKLRKEEKIERETSERLKFEIIDELKPLPGEVYIRKSSPSAFWGTYLVAYLISEKIDTLIVAGESTSGCVRATVVDGRTHGYRMILVEDCVFDRTEASHAINLFDMHQKYADVVSLGSVIEKIRAWQEKRSQI